MSTLPPLRRLVAPAVIVVVALVGLFLVLTRDDAPVTADVNAGAPTTGPTATGDAAPTDDQAAAQADGDDAPDEQRAPSATRMQPLCYDDPDHPLTIGDPEAPLVMVEFSSFGCLWCGNLHRVTMPEVMTDWVDTGQLRIETRAMPYTSQAMPGARMVVAAAKQDRYWELAKVVYPWISMGKVPQGNLEGGELTAYQARQTEDALFAMIDEVAADLEVDMAQLRADYDDPATLETVQRDTDLATQLGFTGTPGMLINTVPVGGYLPPDQMDELLTNILEASREPDDVASESASQ